MKRILPFLVVSALLHTLIVAGFKKIRHRSEVLHELTTTEIHTSGAHKASSPIPMTQNQSVNEANPEPTGAAQGNGNSQQQDSIYEANLSQEIARYKKYPPQSKSLGQQGEVTVGFRIMGDGSITDLSVEKSSEYSLLDQAALQIFKEMGQAPKPPEGWPEQGKVFIQKIQYYLD